jgi:hypothetical protein
VIISRWIFLGIRNISDKSCTEIQKKILCSTKFLFPQIVPFFGGDNVEKFNKATDGNMAHAHCMMDT